MSSSPERRLWQHVLLAISADLQSTSENAKRDRDFARRWVGQYSSKDFQLVCDLAGLEAECVHRYFRQMAENDRASGRNSHGWDHLPRQVHACPRGRIRLSAKSYSKG